MARFFRIALVALAAPAGLWGSAAVAQVTTIYARDCSVVIQGDNNTVNMGGECSPRIHQYAIEIEEVVADRQVDRDLLDLIRRGRFDEALARIEALTVQPTANSSTYFALAASIIALRGAPAEAMEYSRRAYEIGRTDALAAIRYSMTLGLNGRQADARAVITDAYRRRAQFSAKGAVWIESAWTEINYPPQVLTVWFQARSCPSAPAATGPSAAAPDAEGQACPLDAETNRNVRALRETAARIAREAAAAGLGSRTLLQLRYHNLHYVLLCDVLLGETDGALRAEREMGEVAAQIGARFGPWALLTSFSAGSGLDDLTPPAYLASKYATFGQAMRDAATAPVTSLAAVVGDDQLLQGSPNSLLAAYRLFWTRAEIRIARYPDAWRSAMRALEEVRDLGNSPEMVQIRLQALSLMASISDSDGLTDVQSVLSSEYARLRNSFSQDPRLWQSLGPLLIYLQGQLCEAAALSGADCRAGDPSAR